MLRITTWYPVECNPSDDLLSKLEAGEIPDGKEVQGDHGVRRTIIPNSDQDCVVKFRETDDPRVDQNRQEIRKWEQYEEMRDIFVPIREHSDEWIVEDRYDEHVTSDGLVDIGQTVWGRGWMCIDFRESNVMKDGNDVRIVDFESCKPKETAKDWQIDQFKDRI